MVGQCLHDLWTYRPTALAAAAVALVVGERGAAAAIPAAGDATRERVGLDVWDVTAATAATSMRAISNMPMIYLAVDNW